MNVGNLKDEAVVVLVRTQNQELYRVLVKRYQKKLWRYAHFLVKDAQEAQDVVQEAFIKAFVNLQGFDTKKKFSSWLYRIVHNEAVNRLKKQKKKVSLEANQWLKEMLPAKTNLEEEYTKKETKKMVRRCLDQLPVSYQAPLVLYYLEDKSYLEISEILRLPMGTVGVRLQRAKKMMKQLLKKDENDEKTI